MGCIPIYLIYLEKNIKRLSGRRRGTWTPILLRALGPVPNESTDSIIRPARGNFSIFSSRADIICSRSFFKSMLFFHLDIKHIAYSFQL